MWLVYVLFALVIWGLWGFFPKMATLYLKPESIIVYEIIGALLVGIITLFFLKLKPGFNSKGIIFAILTGIAGTLGALFFLLALKHGKATVVVASTSLYPVITILLIFFILKEPITIKQGIGIILAFIAIFLLSS